MNPFKKALILMAMAVGVGGTLLAQTGVPKLSAEEGQRQWEMVLEKLDLQVDILGPVSETRMTMTFRNPHDRVLEGELTFPLPAGATVSGYALDVNGRMVDGVAVEKEKARQVFEAEVRRGVDPGIIEKVAGNFFRTRVYPLPARGTRTVRVRFLSELDLHGDSALYRLPLALPYTLRKLTLKAVVMGDRIEPRITETPVDDLRFTPSRQAFLAEGTRENVHLKGNLRIELPQISRQKAFTMKAPDGLTYFYAWDKPASPVQTVLDKSIRNVTLFWDASASRGKVSHEKEFAFLRSCFSNSTRDVTVLVREIRNRMTPGRPVVVRNGNAEELITFLKSVFYDGATDLGTLGDAREDCDLALLFSDGISTWGEGINRFGKAPLYAINAADGADLDRLQALAESSGGTLIDLMRISQQDAVNRVGRPVFQFLGVSDAPVSRLYPRQPVAVQNHQIVCGVLDSRSCDLDLLFGAFGKPDLKTAIHLEADEQRQGTLLMQFWAQKKVEELMRDASRNRDDLLKTGKRYGLVTSETSLIVLERLDQYLQHRIMPPPSLPELREAYKRHLSREDGLRKERERSKMNRVLAMWRERVAWYKTDFGKLKPTKPVMQKEEASRGGIEGGVEGGIEGGVDYPGLGNMADEALPAPRAEAVAMRTQDASQPEQAKALGKKGRTAPPRKTVTVEIKPFDPQTPYLEALKEAAPRRMGVVYQSLRETYAGSPSFFVDVADFLFRHKQKDLALQVLSNLAEMKLEDAPLLRVLAGRLAMAGEYRLARIVYEQVKSLRGEEPQSYRDLALVLAQQKDYRKAAELLNQVIFRDWDRFNGIEVIALMELNRIIDLARRAGIEDLPVSPALVQSMGLDVRIVLTWDADSTDIDLHVVEPTGEEVFYSHKRSSSGGLISNDFTQGYGPEEYLVRKAIPGTYKVRVKYYANHAQRLLGPVTVKVDLITRFGRPDEKTQTVLMRLDEAKEMIDVAEMKW